MIPPYRVRYAPICLWNFIPAVSTSKQGLPAVQKMTSRLRTNSRIPKIMPRILKVGLFTPAAGSAVKTTTPRPAIAAKKGMNLQNLNVSPASTPSTSLVRNSHPVMVKSALILVVASQSETIARNPPIMAIAAQIDMDPLPV